jgi:hypothetical protein
MTGFGSCSSEKLTLSFLRRTKGELSRSTRVCTLVFPALTGQGGITVIEDLLWRDPIVLRLMETDRRLDKFGADVEIRNISDVESRDEVGVTVAEFRIVPEREDTDKLRELPDASEPPEKVVIESRVPGEAEKKDDRDELDMLLKRVVSGVAVG